VFLTFAKVICTSIAVVVKHIIGIFGENLAKLLKILLGTNQAQ
jgi:hypothetical protein